MRHLDITLDAFRWSHRAKKCFIRFWPMKWPRVTMRQLAAKSSDDILALKGVGVTTLCEIRQKLRSYSLDLGMEDDEACGIVSNEQLQIRRQLVSDLYRTLMTACSLESQEYELIDAICKQISVYNPEGISLRVAKVGGGMMDVVFQDGRATIKDVP